MGTILASEVIERAAAILNDQSNEIWTEAELLMWLNDAQREVAKAVPEASYVVENLSLAEGTKQSIPSDGLRLMDVTRNMGTGTTSAPGKAITLLRREELDRVLPGWHSLSIKSTTIDYFIFDPRMPKTFFVYPPSSANVKVEIAYSVLPDEVGSTSSAITIDDIYATALVDYLVYRAQCKDREDQGRGQSLAAAFYTAFQSGLGIQPQATAALSPGRHTDEFIRQPKT